MLEIKDLVRVYKPKKGAPVRALDGVSLRFPDTGMIFLLGKSGSGKSTLLNVMGGLDKYDSGEIIIKGKSSKNFSQDDFDSYRNTYLGFIFQEYNILDEFSVGVNIGLALQLQGQKVTEDAINKILAEVDMGGYGNRNPNELSGGQKQRVAIARALVKNPEIIMADEPTGALDSATGLQVFDTLKKLSKDKLVIVVTHDREFAELYGDRVIELKDGRVISDITKYKCAAQNASEGLRITDDSIIQIKQGYHLTQTDLDILNNYLEQRDAVITLDDTLNETVRKAAKLDERGQKEAFHETDNNAVISNDSKPFKLIKSRLPFKHSFKMGASSLKHKRIRLIITIFLSFIAFAMFGLADTVSAYDKVTTLAQSVQDTGVDYLSFSMAYRDIDDGGYSMPVSMTQEDIDNLNQQTGYGFKPVYNEQRYGAYSIYNFKNQNLITPYYTSTVSGFYEVASKEELEALGFTVTGTMPTGNHEIAITEYLYSHYTKAGYTDNIRILDSDEIATKADFLAYDPVINFNGKNYLVTAIIDTHFNTERYAPIDKEYNSIDIGAFVLLNELQTVTNYGYHCLAFVKEGFTNQFMEERDNEIGLALNDMGTIYLNNQTMPNYGLSTQKITTTEELTENDYTVFYLEENESRSLGENDVLVNLCDALGYFYDSGLSVNISLDNPAQISDYLDNNRESIRQLLNGFTIQYIMYYPLYYQSEELDANIKGFFLDNENMGMLAVSDTIYERYDNISLGSYSFAITAMPKGTNAIKELAEFYYGQEESGYYYSMHNEVNVLLDMVNSLFEDLAKVFLYVGLGLALFASLMLTNYISTSITYKKREIGILRAVGARSSDVFGIFFNESLIIALINFVLAVAASVATVIVINTALRTNYGLLITFLIFGIRQVALMLGVSLVVAFIASFLPVIRIARKRPVDAINNR
ncbi:MAG: ATP-binding cassette domain-containing protein [Clostridia bacterium]|nr:ATP-binding cassette domain-containing protein [Clostridia bacterium]